MRRALVGIAAAVLLLAGCGGGGAVDPFSTGSEEECIGYGCSDEQDAEILAQESAANAEPVPVGTPTPTGPATNSRGNIEAAIGDEGFISERDVWIATFTVDDVAPLACDARYADPAENGSLIGVTLRVSTAPELGDSYLSISGSDFSFIGSSGITVRELATMATYGCVDDRASLFPSGPLGPGQEFVGTVVLDVPEPAGVLMFYPSGRYHGGWEVTF